MKIALERCINQIYDRIVLELANGFRQCGHECKLVQPSDIKSNADLLEAYNQCDWAIISNSMGLLSLKGTDTFFFEDVDPKLVFIHHDAPFGTEDLQAINDKLDAFVRIKDRSVHFTIEKSDEVDLKKLGIQCHPITHINSLGPNFYKGDQSHLRNVAFLGHVVPPIDQPIAFGNADDMAYFQSYLSRVAKMDHSVKSDFDRVHPANSEIMTASDISLKMQYIQYVNRFSMFQRGALLQGIQRHDLHIFGGDPAWMHGVEQTRFLAGDSIHYHPAVFDRAQVAEVFATSRININITSLQFDSAVINRVLDCAAAGGFMLTDKKAQLAGLTAVADEISYSTLEELESKVDYYSHPDNQRVKNELTQQLRSDLSVSCSMANSVIQIINRMATF